MNATKYNLIFCFCQSQIWKIADTQNKCCHTFSQDEFKKWHKFDNIYFIYRQRDQLAQIGRCVYFDLYEGLPIEQLMIATGKDEIESMVEYFLQVRQQDFKIHFDLCHDFGLSRFSLSKTKAKLAAEILHARSGKWIEEDDSYPSVIIEKYQDVARRIGRETFTAEVAGMECKFGFGGIHGARKKYISSGEFVNIDVSSMYPSIMLKDKLLSRSAARDDYRLIYERKEANPSLSLKILLNSVYGAMNEPYNPLYDPSRLRKVTKYGQLYMLDLIEKLWPFEIIQANTDSVLIKMPDDWNKQSDGKEIFYLYLAEIVFRWQIRTELMLHFDYIKFIAQKDVNNYIAIDRDDDNKIYRCGAYAKEYNKFEKQNSIITEAVIKYVTRNISVEDTINRAKQEDFISYIHTTDKYEGLYLGGRRIGNAAAIYAGRYGDKLMQKRIATNKLEKVAGTPDKCATRYENVDKTWYINQAKKRLEAFGYGSISGIR